VKQLRRRKSGAALLLTTAFSVAESSLAFAVVSLLVWFAPPESAPDFVTLLFEGSAVLDWTFFVAYALVVAFLEPFYVAAGFAMYLNRRAELEAWDLEQELRRAFAA
jgi:hypothetical protein